MLNVLNLGSKSEEFATASYCCSDFEVSFTTIDKINKLIISDIKSDIIDLVVVRAIQDLKIIKSINNNQLCCFITTADENILEILSEYPFTQIIAKDDINGAVNTLLTIHKRKILENVAATTEDPCCIHFKTFGQFDMYVDGKPYHWKSPKAKELMAVLVHNQGATLYTEEMATALWPDRPYDVSVQNLCSKIRKWLRDILTELGQEDILVVERSSCSLDTSKVTCDLYSALNGNLQAIASFQDAYMSQYWWGEETLAWLQNNL